MLSCLSIWFNDVGGEPSIQNFFVSLNISDGRERFGPREQASRALRIHRFGGFDHEIEHLELRGLELLSSRPDERALGFGVQPGQFSIFAEPCSPASD